MDTDSTAAESDTVAWDFPTLAFLWDYRSRSILAGADRLESISDVADRDRCVTGLIERVMTLAGELDDGWLSATALIMVDDLYRSYFNRFRWSPGVRAYIAASAGTLALELARRGFTLHYVIDNTQTEDRLEEALTWLPQVFDAAGLMTVGPQLMALEVMEKIENRPRDVAAIPQFLAEGHDLADQLITRCHREQRHSVYLNLDRADDGPGLSLDAALSAAGTPGAVVVFRNQPPIEGTTAQIAPPPGVTLPTDGPS